MYTEKDLNELEAFFKSIPKANLPAEIEVVQAQKVTDVPKFINAHLACVKSNIGRNAYTSFYDRLVRLKELLSAK